MPSLTLLKHIKDAAILEGDFTTRAGHKTNYYVDKYLFETKPHILKELADELAKIMPSPDTYDHIAAPELGAVPIAAVLSIKVNKPFVIVKKQSKDYGTKKLIEGEFNKNEKMLMIEDILTTGGAALKACETLKQHNIQITEILGIFNREEGATQNITNAGLQSRSLYTKSDLNKL